MLLEELAAAGGVHQPVALDFATGKRDPMRPLFREIGLQTLNTAFEAEARILAANFEHMRFEKVAVELEGGEIGAQPDEAFAVVFEALIFEPIDVFQWKRRLYLK